MLTEMEYYLSFENAKQYIVWDNFFGCAFKYLTCFKKVMQIHGKKTLPLSYVLLKKKKTTVILIVIIARFPLSSNDCVLLSRGKRWYYQKTYWRPANHQTYTISGRWCWLRVMSALRYSYLRIIEASYYFSGVNSTYW